MKRLFLVFSLAVALLGCASFNAQAVPIKGGISFSGTIVPDNFNLNIVNAFNGFSNAVVAGGTGDYAAVSVGTPVMFTPFSFRPFFSPVRPLWTFESADLTYSFDAERLTNAFSSSTVLALEGSGTAYVTGFDNTPGYWSLTANSGGQTASFSASAAPVPEPVSLVLLGVGLIFVGTVGRHRIKR